LQTKRAISNKYLQIRDGILVSSFYFRNLYLKRGDKLKPDIQPFVIVPSLEVTLRSSRWKIELSGQI